MTNNQNVKSRHLGFILWDCFSWGLAFGLAIDLFRTLL